MLSIQHAMCLYEKHPLPSSKLIAATIYPDAIRAYTGPRVYSHFEKQHDGKDSSYMAFPDSMKAKTEEVIELVQQKGHKVDDIKPCAIGEDTDFTAFCKHNGHLDMTMFKGIGYHLKQDIEFDTWIRKQIDCSDKYNDKFTYKDKTYDGKEIRNVIGKIEQQCIYHMAKRLYDKHGIIANQEWLENNIKPALEKEYPEDLADKTFSFMKIDPEINELITKEDFSKLDDFEIPKKDFDMLYDVVQASMARTSKDESRVLRNKQLEILDMEYNIDDKQIEEQFENSGIPF